MKAVEAVSEQEPVDPLVPPEFQFDAEVLEDAFRQGATALILCNPSNPSGKVFTREELIIIVNQAKKYDAWVRLRTRFMSTSSMSRMSMSTSQPCPE